MFSRYSLELADDVFRILKDKTDFEPILEDKAIANIIKPDEEKGYPIIRTAIKYKKSAKIFLDIHNEIISKICEKTQIPSLKFNNAIIEIFSSRYNSMAYHSHQMLDIVKDSYIAIFSCYKNGVGNRSLLVKNKLTNHINRIPMEHNSVIIFSTLSNIENYYKIVLDNSNDNEWLGITFRLSNTFIKYDNDGAYFTKNKNRLKVANDKERIELYRLRNIENRNVGLSYPEDIYYTINESDLVKPS